MTRKNLRPWLLLFGLYLLIALAVTWPATLDLGGSFIGHPTGDSYEMGHHLWWFSHALKTGEPVFYQSLLAYPDGLGGLSLWSNPLQFFPAWALAFVMPVAMAYNVQVLLTLALNGLAMAYMVSRLAERECWPGAGKRWYPPAVLAGAAYLAFPMAQGHLFAGHGGLLVMWPAAFWVDALLELRANPRRGAFIRAALWAFVTPWGHTLQAIFVVLPVGGIFALLQLLRREWRAAALTIASVAVGMILLAAWVLPVASDAFSDTYTGDQGYLTFSADVLSPLTPSHLNPLLGQVFLPYNARILGTNISEGYGYWGIIGLILMALGLWKIRISRWFLPLLILATVLSFGPVLHILGRPATLRLDNIDTFVTMPWAFLYNLPGFSLARTPGRFGFAVALAAVPMMAAGAAFLYGLRISKSARTGLLLVLTVLLLADYQLAMPFPIADARVPEPIAALRDRDDVRAVMDMPWGNLLAAKRGLYLQTVHEKPLIAGQVTRRTPVSPAKLTVLEDTLDLALLDAAGVDAIIAHKVYASETLMERLRASATLIYEDSELALFEVPDAQFASTFFMATGEQTSSSYDLHFYAPEAGWVTLNASVRANARNFSMLLDGKTFRAFELEGRQELESAVYLSEAGYHTVTLALTPDCPTLFSSDLIQCQGLAVEYAYVTPVSDPVSTQVHTLENGIRLESATVQADGVAGSNVQVRLWWSFSQGALGTDLRFMKILGADGQEIAGTDGGYGAQQPGAVVSDVITLFVPPNIPAGTYQVVAGWYRYPELTRYAVEGERDGLIPVGELRIRQP
jgi:hypothetical protein